MFHFLSKIFIFQIIYVIILRNTDFTKELVLSGPRIHIVACKDNKKTALLIKLTSPRLPRFLNGEFTLAGSRVYDIRL